MKLSIASFLSGLIALSTAVSTNIDPNDFCQQQLLKRGNQKVQQGYFEKPNDCHNYYQCFFYGDVKAIGFERKCQPGMFWDQRLNHCVLEGESACSPHPCNSANQNSTRRYRFRGQPCNSFFICGLPVTTCCDSHQRFNPDTGDCDYDPSCREPCRPQSLYKTEAMRLTESTCRDIHGNILQSQPNPRKFFLGDSVLHCAVGSEFDLETCRCNKIVEMKEPVRVEKLCPLYLPFDGNLHDHSAWSLATSAHHGAQIDMTSAARGGGSLRLFGNYSHLSVDDFSKVKLGHYNEASFCFFVLCRNNGDDTLSCNQRGSIISNAFDELLTDFTFIAAVQPGSIFETRIGTSSNPGAVRFGLKKGWNQICAVWEVSQLRLYLNTVIEF